MSPFNFDPDPINNWWRERQDVEQAVRRARESLERLPGAELAMRTKLAIAEAAADALFDGPARDPLFVLRTLDDLAVEWRFSEAAYPTTPEERLRNRVNIENLRARSWHIAGYSRRALEHGLAAHNQIENLAGGREALLLQLADPAGNVIAESMVRMLGIISAALKRTLPPEKRRYWVSELRAMTDAYMLALAEEPANVYPGAPALVQVLYLLAEQGDTQDIDRIAQLRALDVRVRPDDARGRATIPLREIAIARYSGDAQAVADLAPQVYESLCAHGLPRHLYVVSANRYA